MISIAIFLIVVTVGMESLLNASSIHDKTQAIRSIMDSLNFTMDDMSRNIRTGSIYNCVDSNSSNVSINCINGRGISFTSSDGVTILNYYFDSSNNLQKINGGNPAVQLNPDEVQFDPSSSGFTVIGAEPQPTSLDNLQPFVTIRLNGTITTKGTTTPFSLQTSVSQRLVDI